jgi:hypothetical protein
VRVDIHAQVSAHERQFTRLGSGLARTLAGFEMDPLRLRVRATAGSGKTFVAHAFFERAVARGRRPLLVCFNRPLAERLQALMGQAGWVSTFFGLCDAFLADRGHRLDFEQMKTDREFWRRVADMVTAETVSDGWRFDCLIVDEGQDFEQEWFEILRLFLRDDADVLWLEDPDQNLLGKPSVRLDGFARFSTAVNHRMPATIARFIERVLPIPFECGSLLPGLGVTVTPYERSEDQPREVGKIVDGLLAQGFGYPDIAVVTLRSGRRSVFTGRARAGPPRPPAVHRGIRSLRQSGLHGWAPAVRQRPSIQGPAGGGGGTGRRRSRSHQPGAGAASPLLRDDAGHGEARSAGAGGESLHCALPGCRGPRCPQPGTLTRDPIGQYAAAVSYRPDPALWTDDFQRRRQ